MKNKIKKGLIQLLFISFLMNLLVFSEETMELASKGLLIWYRNMIPSLFPFMVLSGILVRTGTAAKISSLFHPVCKFLFPVTPHMLYAIIMGFLCGFPMGAKVVGDLLEKGQITRKQGEYLLAFCNNIGPLYMLGYVLPLFGWKKMLPVFFLMYGIPLLYGCVLGCHPAYKDLKTEKRMFSGRTREIRAAQYHSPPPAPSFPAPSRDSYGTAFQLSLENAIKQITLLGGCMVFFNCLQIYPRLLAACLPDAAKSFYMDYLYAPLCCLLEIGGGLEQMAAFSPHFSSLGLCFLTFGGLSCIVQTVSLLKDSGLSIKTYIGHKILQTVIIFFFLFLL